VRFRGQPVSAGPKASAIVNGEAIAGVDIDQRMALIRAFIGMQLSPAEVERFRPQLLRNLIDETLVIQAARQQEIVIGEPEVDRIYERFTAGFRQAPGAYSAYLRSIGSSESALKRQIRGELAWRRLMRSRIEPYDPDSDESARAVLDRLRASRGVTEYKVSEIFLSSTQDTSAQVQANAERIIEQLRAGGSFLAYARQFSEASTSAVGGDLGWVRLEQLPAELAAIVPQIPVGSVSNPVPIPGGFSIVAVADMRQILVADPRDAILSLIQVKVALPPEIVPAQAEARAGILGEATRKMGGCGGAAATAQQLGAELAASDQVRVRDLPPHLRPVLLDLGVGQATPVLVSAGRISVLVLCGRDDPLVSGRPGEEDEQRIARRAQRYLRDLRRDALIEYR
jgi:peptidyl-prolyl cis-trans isomerase SurA